MVSCVVPINAKPPGPTEGLQTIGRNVFATSDLATASTPVKIDTAGEREILIHTLRTAVARERLIVNTLETIGVSLRHKVVDAEGAMLWLKDERLLHLIDFGPQVQK